MICYWHHPVVRPSVRPSVCNAVTASALWLSGSRCSGLKVVPACSYSKQGPIIAVGRVF